MRSAGGRALALAGVLGALTAMLLATLCKRTLWGSAPVGRAVSALVSPSDARLIVDQAHGILKQKISVLDMLTDEDFVRKNQRVFNSSVGGHMRHSLDHFQAIVTAADATILPVADYDTRARNTLIETNRAAARSCIVELMGKLDAIDVSKSIDVTFIGETQTFRSYRIPSHVARELSFAAHHGIHHMSLVKVLLLDMGYTIPDEANIGMAASTVKEEQRLARERSKETTQISEQA